MSATFTEATSAPDPQSFSLSPQQVRYFETFGFVHLRGLLADQIATVTAAFEEVFASDFEPYIVPENPYHQANDERFADKPRVAVIGIDGMHPVFEELTSDPRLLTIARTLLGPGFEYQNTDGNLFYCDVYWHLDGYGTTTDEEHIKLYIYLDALRADSGALRVIPGTHIDDSVYTTNLRQLFFDIERTPEKLGVELDEIPAHTIEVNPGDVVVGNFRTIHGSFHGGPRRRLVTMDFHRAAAA